MHEIIIRVNDTNFNMNYYIKTLKYYGEGQPSYYIAYLADEVVKIIEQNINQKSQVWGRPDLHDLLEQILLGVRKNRRSLREAEDHPMGVRLIFWSLLL